MHLTAQVTILLKFPLLSDSRLHATTCLPLIIDPVEQPHLSLVICDRFVGHLKLVVRGPLKENSFLNGTQRTLSFQTFKDKKLSGQVVLI